MPKPKTTAARSFAGTVRSRQKQVKYAEAFEICEYGRQPSESENPRTVPVFSRSLKMRETVLGNAFG